MRASRKAALVLLSCLLLGCSFFTSLLETPAPPGRPTVPPAVVDTGSAAPSPGPSQAAGFPTPPPSARIAFSATGWSVPGAGYEIFVANVDGSGITPITNSRGSDRQPAWSPDGMLIAFASERDGNWEIYVMNRDGSSQVRLTDSPAHDAYPTWSPDGSRIAFASDRDGNQEIYVMNRDGSDPIRLTFTAAQDTYPDWSPDGRLIAFSSFGDDHAGIYVMNADGSDYRQLVSGPLHNPAWSSDGRFIAFDGEPGGNRFEVYIVKADGSEMRQLTSHGGPGGGYDKNPSWSPEGGQIVYFQSTQEAGTNGTVLNVINTDGTGELRITQIRVEGLYNSPVDPDWSPLP